MNIPEKNLEPILAVKQEYGYQTISIIIANALSGNRGAAIELRSIGEQLENAFRAIDGEFARKPSVLGPK